MTARIALIDTDRAYLQGQPLGHLATVDDSGAPQNNPIGAFLDEETGDIVVGGHAMGATRKFHNVQANAHVALVIDDLVSADPWTVRGLEVRGTAVALFDVDPPVPFMSREVLRITPTWVTPWDSTPACKAGRPEAGAEAPEWRPVEGGPNDDIGRRDEWGIYRPMGRSLSRLDRDPRRHVDSEGSLGDVPHRLLSSSVLADRSSHAEEGALTIVNSAHVANRYALLPMSQRPTAVATMTMIRSVCRSIHAFRPVRTSSLRSGRTTE
jgi:pyridoxamine 5'-phosphate oxidase family protein